MNTHGFTSMFGPQLDDYLAFKQQMGFYGASRIWFFLGLTVEDDPSSAQPSVRGRPSTRSE